VVLVFLASIAEALVKMDTSKWNDYHIPFLGNYSITNKSTCVCKCDVAIGWYCMFNLNMNLPAVQKNVSTIKVATMNDVDNFCYKEKPSCAT